MFSPSRYQGPLLPGAVHGRVEQHLRRPRYPNHRQWSGNFAIVGPNWKGKLPPGVTALHSPTSTVWMIGRIQTNTAADYAFVHSLQDQIRLTPLAIGKPPKPPPSQEKYRPTGRTPLAEIEKLDTNAFFSRLCGPRFNPAGAGRCPADAPSPDPPQLIPNGPVTPPLTPARTPVRTLAVPQRVTRPVPPRVTPPVPPPVPRV